MVRSSRVPFHVLVEDTAGKELLRQETDHLALAMPSDLAFAAGLTYTWIVDATAPDGKTFHAEAQVTCMSAAQKETLEALRAKHLDDFAQASSMLRP